MKIAVLLLAGATLAQGANKVERAFSLFNVVAFKNDPCDSTETIASSTTDNNQRQGNCVSGSECSDQKGTAAGSCAAGFGVCCVFTKNDEDDTSFDVYRNNTYLQNPNFPSTYTDAETFTYTLKKQDKDICALRIDFETFMMNGPAGADDSGTCDTDKLEITISSGTTVPVVCGSNSGQHMYLYLGMEDDTSTTATAKLTTTGTGNRNWDIRVGQIACTSDYLPPEGCLQYHMDASGTIKSFNFDVTDSHHLPNQDYTVCTRRRAGFCCVEYFPCTDDNSFTIGGMEGVAMQSAGCPNDFITIPGGSPSGNPFANQQNRFCGTILGNLAGSLASVPIRSCTSYEFGIFTDDALDVPSPTNNRGVCVNYKQLPC